MQCEVCGHQIFGEPVRAVIEGANLNVCSKCAKLSSGYWEPKAEPKMRPKRVVQRQPTVSFAKRPQRPAVTESVELVDNVGQLVREARREREMSHEDLGRKISEKVSLLRKIESGKMVPDLALAERLEHALKITLRVPATEPKIQQSMSSKPSGTTLGDIIQFKMKDKEAKR